VSPLDLLIWARRKSGGNSEYMSQTWTSSEIFGLKFLSVQKDLMRNIFSIEELMQPVPSPGGAIYCQN